MNDKPHGDLHARFADVLGNDRDPGMHTLIRALSDQYRPAQPPHHLRARIQHIAQSRAGQMVQTRRLPHWNWFAVPLVALLLAVMATGAVFAVQGAINLGGSTNNTSTNAYFPIGGFHRVRAHSAVRLPPGLLFVYSQRSPSDAAEEWPVVKALEQFGTLSRIQAAAAICSPVTEGRTSPPIQVCDPPTFDLSHARFTSPYVRASFQSLADRSGRCTAARLPASDWSILMAYAGVNTRDRSRFCREWNYPLTYPGLTFVDPALIVGSYVQSGVELVQPGDFEELAPSATPTVNGGGVPETGLPFAVVQKALVTGDDPAQSTLVQDVNAEANIITALICHTDGGKPKSVCGRSVIRKLLRHVK